MTTHAERVPCTASHLSDFARVKVDVAQTGFFRGREFRTFKEINIGAGQTYVVKAEVLGNLILQGLDLVLDDGVVRLTTVVGGAAGGTWAETLPVFNRNNMSIGPDREALVAATTVLTAGGTHTGGTVLDIVRLRAANATGAASSVGLSASDERGIAAGTYYFRLENLGAGAAVGVWRARWEERG